MLDILIKDAPTESDVKESLEGFVNRVLRALSRWGISEVESINDEALGKAHAHAMMLLRRYESPSCFKAASALTLGLVSARPFKVALPADFGELANKPNAVFAVLESVYWMHDAELLLNDGANRLVTLSNQIEFSDHFFFDFVKVADSLAWPTPIPTGDIGAEYDSRFKLLSLTFEALAYQFNSHCKYPPPHALQLDKYFSTLD